MALGLLLVLFMVMSIISVMGLVLLFLLKGEKGCVLLYGGMGHDHRMDDGE